MVTYPYAYMTYIVMCRPGRGHIVATARLWLVISSVSVVPWCRKFTSITEADHNGIFEPVEALIKLTAKLCTTVRSTVRRCKKTFI